ncbi:hypothetical protein JCM9279_003516 [Rhodotorula babjevae]
MFFLKETSHSSRSAGTPTSLDLPTFSPADFPSFPAAPSLFPPAPLDWHAGGPDTALSIPSASPPSLLSPSSTTDSSSTHLSPLAPSTPSTLVLPASTSSSTSSRPSAAPLVDLDAPIRPQGVCLLPSTTARKTLTVKGAKLLAKKQQQHGAQLPVTPGGAAAAPSSSSSTSSATAPKEPAIPPDVAAAMERKRVQNTLSARRCRAKKQARVAELEEENEALRRRVEELERRCRERGMAL